MKHVPKTVLSMPGLISLLAMVGCSSGGDATPAPVQSSSNPPARLLDEAALAELTGAWEQRGYGNLFVFEGDRTTLFSLNEATCLEIVSFDGVAGIPPEELEQTLFGLEGDELSLLVPGSAFPVRLTRLDTLPARCDEPVASDAQGVFDYVWNTFDEYYAFFELRGVDWAEEYARQLPRVGDVDDDADLFGLISDLLSPIDDRNVLLASDDAFFSPAVERGAIVELRRGFEAQDDTEDFGDYVDGLIRQLQLTVLSRMDEGSLVQEGPMAWATAADGATGYLFIENMVGFAADEDGGSTDLEELAAAREVMDRFMVDMADTTRLIVDVRLNGGGLDAIALDFAGRFVGERQRAFSKTARGRDVESVPVEAFLEPPSTGAYPNPVTLIVGADTAGAAEVFAIPLHRQPQVTVIGEGTAGILSDRLNKPLPNRWGITLSNEVYLDSEGVSFERVGLSPEIEVPVFRVADILAGEDPAVDRALAMP